MYRLYWRWIHRVPTDLVGLEQATRGLVVRAVVLALAAVALDPQLGIERPSPPKATDDASIVFQQFAPDPRPERPAQTQLQSAPHIPYRMFLPHGQCEWSIFSDC
jgi:hypothetical protein